MPNAISAMVNGVVIAIAWIIYHPLIGIAILGVALFVFGLVIGGVALVVGKRKQ